MKAAWLGALLLIFAVSCSAPSPRTPTPLEQSIATPGLSVIVNHTAPADDLRSSLICPAVLIEPDRILTASHCVTGRAAASLDVIVEPKSLCYGDEIAGERRRVRSIALAHQADIATLTLAHAVGTEPAALAGEAALADGVAVTAYGWGHYGPSSPTPCRARPVTGIVEDSPECDQLLERTPMWAALNQFCVRPEPTSDRSTCTDDSGGPIYRMGPSAPGTRPVLLGVASWGPTCNPADLAVFARPPPGTASGDSNRLDVGPSGPRA